jgi:hypothetical protein
MSRGSKSRLKVRIGDDACCGGTRFDGDLRWHGRRRVLCPLGCVGDAATVMRAVARDILDLGMRVGGLQCLEKT